MVLHLCWCIFWDHREIISINYVTIVTLHFKHQHLIFWSQTKLITRVQFTQLHFISLPYQSCLAVYWWASKQRNLFWNMRALNSTNWGKNVPADFSNFRHFFWSLSDLWMCHTDLLVHPVIYNLTTNFNNNGLMSRMVANAGPEIESESTNSSYSPFEDENYQGNYWLWEKLNCCN